MAGPSKVRLALLQNCNLQSSGGRNEVDSGRDYEAAPVVASDGSKLKINFFDSIFPKLLTLKMIYKKIEQSGCGSVGRIVASYKRGPQFESRHRQNLY